MLDDSNLSKLKQLKQTIEDQKEFAEGIVKATTRRFGFVVLDDGREIYLAPDEMDKVFPGDKVKIEVFTEQTDKQKTGAGKAKKNNAPKAKTHGTLLKVLDSPLSEFTGRYIVKGKGHFVTPDLTNLSRWIFIPPAKRKNATSGDFIRCRMSKHPYPHGKPQAVVTQVIGALNRPGIEADYVVNKFSLEQELPENWQDSLIEPDTSAREDKTDIPFVTIDAPSTVDMDDAIYATKTDDGWQLQVAIADPCSMITNNSELEKILERRGTSVYLPGKSIPMLPSELSNDSCSLMPMKLRAVILCTASIDKDGTLGDFHFSEASIRSRAKLSYNDVSRFLKGDVEPSLSPCKEHAQTLQDLSTLSQALFDKRKSTNLVFEGRPNFRLLLNSKRKLESIEPLKKTKAHAIVEECMVAANRCVSMMLGDSGLFITHAGFRKERVADVKKLVDEQLGKKDIDPASLDGYKNIMRDAESLQSEFPLRSVLSRLLEKSRFDNQASPHFGMGLDTYTTFTSPIRKYSDFLVHRMVKGKIRGEEPTVPSAEVMQRLQLVLDNTRNARNQMEQHLKCQFIEPLVGQSMPGHVSQINSNGFSVRLDDNHVEGFVETRQMKEKYSFDPMRMRLTSKHQVVELEQAITITISSVDCDRREIRFSILPGPKQ